MNLIASKDLVLAHGIGGRADFPVTPWLAMYAGTAAVAFSFYALASFWSEPRLRGARGGVSLGVAGKVVDAVLLRAFLKTVGLLLLAAFLTVAWLGPDDFGRSNPAPTWFYVWFWVGLVPLSLALGPAWKLLNPLRTLAGMLGALRLGAPRTLPGWVGYWPAAASLLGFLWVELVDDMAASPHTVATFVSGYCAAHVLGGAIFGPAWFSRCEGFEVYATTVARVSPLGRRADGRVVLRNPLDGLAAAPTSPDLTPIVVVVLGSTAFDGLSRTSWWSTLVANTSRADYLLLGTAGLAGGIAVIGATYLAAMLATRRHLELDANPRADFAPTWSPFAIGYTVAHYFSFALFQGQQGVLLANDPLARGWDLFGLHGASVDYLLLSSTQISIIQISAIVLGHVVAVVAAHDRSVRLLRTSQSIRGQYPLMAVMVAYTAGGIALLAGS